MKVAFSADRRMLGALHVAMMTVLEHWQGEAPEFIVLSEEMDGSDERLLMETLEDVGRPFTLEVRKVEAAQFSEFPKLQGSLATYFRLLVPELITDTRCLYVDADVICLADLSCLDAFHLHECPAAMCSEASTGLCGDRTVKKELKAHASSRYFNAGILLMDCAKWRREGIARKCAKFVLRANPDYHDQSAMNCIMSGRIGELPAWCNRHTNVRTNWPLFRPPHNCRDQLVHLVDYPKPWSAGGRWVHMFGSMWWGYYKRTAHAWSGDRPRARFLWSQQNLRKYKKALKDRVLFALYRRGLMTPKGVAAGDTGSRGASVVQ